MGVKDVGYSSLKTPRWATAGHSTKYRLSPVQKPYSQYSSHTAAVQWPVQQPYSGYSSRTVATAAVQSVATEAVQWLQQPYSGQYSQYLMTESSLLKGTQDQGMSEFAQKRSARHSSTRVNTIGRVSGSHPERDNRVYTE
ncbi:uncharacterized protein BBA_07699 [Beauveria bassiana ARSEF 2860]|uniref:Uncharacterized protein n=1 Tax=Beauveria bassiana (strain ARSEF 2860) TaxID=655819 RepID=J4VYA1_BEAB2|nr:uncharacterized protein BBA_07699 [Beauveria bassiana ARSEF 2860]EJP63305.1 hypothetical protein BBA_07699 [Beauveria bassiana ARSEF 2860]